jgi:hypothetical protein
MILDLVQDLLFAIGCACATIIVAMAIVAVVL